VTGGPRVAPRRATGLALTGGTLLGAACFAVALVADLAGLGGRGFAGGDAAGFIAALGALDAEAWAALGSAIVIATPALGLVLTALEYGSIGDRRAVLFALAVLAILSLSLVVALLT
jgi:hypothetical protein